MPCDHPPPLNPHLPILLEPSIFCRRFEFHLSRLLWRGRNARLGVIGRELALRGGNESNGTLGIITPAIRIGVFLTRVMQATGLIFQPGSIVLVNNSGRDKYQEIALGAGI